MFGRIGADVESTVGADFRQGSLGVVGFPKNESVNVPRSHSHHDRRSTRRRKAHEIYFRQIGTAELRRRFEKQVGIAVRSCTDLFAFKVLPGICRHAAPQRQALGARKHARDNLVVREPLFLHQADIYKTENGNIELVRDQSELDTWISPHHSYVEFDAVLFRVLLQQYHVGGVNLHWKADANLLVSLRFRMQ
jgi:hypothetical protein